MRLVGRAHSIEHGEDERAEEVTKLKAGAVDGGEAVEKERLAAYFSQQELRFCTQIKNKAGLAELALHSYELKPMESNRESGQ